MKEFGIEFYVEATESKNTIVLLLFHEQVMLQASSVLVVSRLVREIGGSFAQYQ
jgi:hypothetical protein